MKLFDDLVEEVLLRFPPDDPASLLRAALVCKRWHRIVSGRHFRRRYRGFHRTPPLLGAIAHGHIFVPTSSFKFQVPAGLRGGRVLDVRHGRILFRDVRHAGDPWDWEPTLSLWDPISGEQQDLPKLPQEPDQHESGSLNFAVLCAAAATGACNHLDCSRGPFLVVAVAVGFSEAFARVYSSQDGEWSEPTFAPHIDDSLGYMDAFWWDVGPFDLMSIVLARDAICFLFHMAHAVVKFDLKTREMELIHLPDTSYQGRIALITTEDGSLGFATTEEHTLRIWSMVAAPSSSEKARWAQSRVIEQLETFLPDLKAIKYPPSLLDSVGAIFFYTDDGDDGGIYTIDLTNSSQAARKMPESFLDNISDVVPFLSFCTPALRAASADEEPIGGTSSA